MPFLKQKFLITLQPKVEGNRRITDDATLFEFLEVDAELLNVSYPIEEQIFTV